MFDFIKKLFSTEANPALKNILDNGATIIDVRTPLEYKGGHVKGSINIPLSTIDGQVGKIKRMKQPIVTCCASGNRSGIAKNKLEASGLTVYNGGGWRTVQKTLEN